jgi:PAS domain-containing protein
VARARVQKSILLIVAREFASRLVTPMLIVDERGSLVFYNEPAEEVIGRTFSEAGEMPASEWATLFQIEDLEGGKIPPEQLPVSIALVQRRPSHRTIRFVALDGTRRAAVVTAFPLFARADELSGAFLIFWEEREPVPPAR